MTPRFRKYNPAQDFLCIRDFLVETHSAFPKPLNWKLERWNYARYFIAPMLGDFGMTGQDPDRSEQAIRFWENAVGVWESDHGEIAGVVNIEHPHPDHRDYGEVFLQRHPRHPDLLNEMLDYAEACLRHPKTHSLHIYVYEHDAPLERVLKERGYSCDVQEFAHDSEYVIGDPSFGTAKPAHPLSLPTGFVLRSMADDGSDIERRREVFGRSFNHPDPADWPSAIAYEELQSAPDYDKSLDLYIAGPDGKYVACCIAWYDRYNQIAMLEPVGTVPDQRRRGLGRYVVMESIRRVAALGARRVYVGSGQQFYQALGFRIHATAYRWSAATQH